MPWRKHHHDATVGQYLQWSHHHSDKNACLASAPSVAWHLLPSQAQVLCECPAPQSRLFATFTDLLFGCPAPGAKELVTGDVTGQRPLLPVPTQEHTLMKKGLDKYFLELRRRGITVDAPFTDPEYTWHGYWNDDTVEQVTGRAVATACIVMNGHGKGAKQAGQCAYYVFSMIRNITCYNEYSQAGEPLGRQFYKMFNRINAVRPALTCTYT
jgi:hypothetical protein